MGEKTMTVPLRVLVVDDCPDTCESIACLLHLWGYDARIAHDGAAALSVAADYRPDVVLLDLAMPGMDGYEVARRLRRCGEGALLVSVSGYGQDDDLRRAAEAGCDLQWVKPTDPDILRDLLASRRPAVRAPWRGGADERI
jgi:CheY-like chemotaxis protein